MAARRFNPTWGEVFDDADCSGIPAKEAAVSGAALRELEFPTGASVMLIVRNNQLIAPRGDTIIQTVDHVYMFFQPKDRSLMDLFFGRAENGGLG